jgi:hypothetical protein
MGTGYKGNSKYYRSIGQNVLIASSKYAYSNGRFGISSPSTGNKTRNIISDDPLSTAKDFYDRIAFGGIESIYDDGRICITQMADGSVVTMRPVSSSPDGSPVVEINVSGSLHTGGVKQQKIHFIGESQ